MELTGTQLEKLRDALVSAFPSKETFDQFLRLKLEFNIEQEVEPANLKITVLKVLEIFGSRNRIVRLLRQARRDNPDNPAMQAVERELLQLFSTEKLLELTKLVSGDALKSERLLSLAEQSVPSNWLFASSLRPELSFQTLFSELVDALSSAPRQSAGTHPLLTFVTHVARDVGGALESELLRWTQRNRAGMTVPTSQAPARQLSRLHLLIKCESSLRGESEAGTVTVTAWIWAMGMDQAPVSGIPDRVLDPIVSPWSKVPELVSQVRKTPKVTALLEQASDQMTVEICLRHELLATAVEGWPIRVGRTPVALGNKHPVVVRSYERNCEGDTEFYRDVLPGWSAKWKQLKQLAEPPIKSPLHWIGPGDIGEKLVNALMRAHVLCVVIPRCCDQDVIERSIDAGAPAMLWLRQDDVPPADARDYIASIIDGPLCELPDRVHKAREDGGLGQHLTLLWDDFDRRPPDPTLFVAP